MPCFTIRSPERVHPGGLKLCYGDDGVTDIELMDTVDRVVSPGNEFEARLLEQFEAYFSEPDFAFDLPLALQGTAHQQRVWAALRTIPAGQVRSYGDLAEELGSSARAVGNACRRNPIPIIVPCHRVVARAGIGGFGGAVSGQLVEQKRRLLCHEGLMF